MPLKIFIKLFSTAILLLYSTLYSQTYSLDDLERISEEYRTSGKIQEIIDFNTKALTAYQKQNNIEGEIAATLNIANYLAVLNKYKESIAYLDKAEAKIKKINNPELTSKLYGGYGRNYSSINLFELSNENIDKAIKYGKLVKDAEKRKKRLAAGYSWKLFNFTKMNMLDSIKSTERKSLAISPDPRLYTNIARRFIETEKNLDSGQFYLDKAMAITDKFPADKPMVLLNYGGLYSEKNNHEKALEYFLQALKYYEKDKTKLNKKNAYKVIAETYYSLGDKEKAAEYLKKYTAISDSISNEEQAIAHIPIKKAVDEKEKEKTKIYSISAIIFLCLIILFYFLRKTYLKRQKQKDEIIIDQTEENEKLKRTLNPAFEEVIQLAKSGTPHFMTRFREVYPEFYEKLTSQYPDLTLGDIKFCAFLKLNFSGKDIMEAENLSIRTVENKKYRLRKKLELTSDVDLGKWMMEF
ncbi:transcriptional regulator [Chryseobacterium sp. MMS23-Vi53]|uniref:transcriptional regulator n=1 Tax=Chryseobacterium sp. MMS23-Vi53 TaxID=3386644 RepID=UPI0039E85BC7